MGRSVGDSAGLAGAAAVALAAAVTLTVAGPKPSADVSRGSEEAFATGLHRRELPAGSGPQRWTTGVAMFGFRNLPRDVPLALTVDVREVRAPVTIVADGVIAARLEPGARAASFALPASDRRTRQVELRADTFRAGDGRELGARLGRGSLDWTARPLLPAPGLLLDLLLSAAAAYLAARFAGATMWPCGAIAAIVVLVEAG